MKKSFFSHNTYEVSHVKRRIFLCILVFSILITPALAKSDYIRWVDFDVDYSAMQRALELDIASQAEEPPLCWIDLLALAATRCGGKGMKVSDIERAAKDFRKNRSPEELLGEQFKYYSYYHEAYHAALGGLVGSYTIQVRRENGETEWVPAYGLKAFSPIAAGYGYAHYDDFGAGRSFGFARRHLGNDLLGALGTPIVAVEGGTVEALGWNRYGGWRIGIRSDDRLRYYYYAHLRKDSPYAPGLSEGQHVNAGDVIGFMGRTGYSDQENTNNIEVVHLHFGLELVFDESQKECDSEIWIDVYHIVRLLDRHRSSVYLNQDTGRWERLYPYRDLDA